MPPPANGGPAAMFNHHFNHYLSILPLATVVTLTVAVTLGLVDFIFWLVDSRRLVTLLDLSYNSVRHSFQVYRLFTYPIVTPSLSLLITNLLFLIPSLLQFESTHGTVPTLWMLFTVCTVLPAIGYLICAALLYTSFIDPWRCAGLSGWAIGLSVWTAVDENRSGEAPDRMLFGVLRIPSKYLPLVVFVFYTLLVPGSSLILHSLVAGISYLLATRRSQLTPSTDSYQWLEARQSLGPIVNARGFVSVQQDRTFLPIFQRSYVEEPVDSSSPAPTASPSTFPGQGQRLGG
ncbi:hypothetical protein K450DRAFT_247009 [Umbelopsis ramanniana AG]|uniref:Peptidase S54 rhomboid domain-containing protein n=1 Tax=Umbelopsis ramanniana AG TaxID=1314678 RepID=A0AAD5HD17_UMBRA|nr:uncharacterized protein K450DRAFT_247009 [Umbelopsis ramanniana AG]KAI8578474.1 hypothetical protein K450DRAFT_247009 [Umbelopsis ramanniana AG]